MEEYYMLLASLSTIIKTPYLRFFAASGNKALGGKSLNQLYSEDPERAFQYVEALKDGAFW